MTHQTQPQAPCVQSAEERFPRREWYGIVESKRIGRQPLGITRLGRRLVLWREPSRALVAQDATCPHRGADLGLGRVVPTDAAILQWHALARKRARASRVSIEAHKP